MQREIQPFLRVRVDYSFLVETEKRKQDYVAPRMTESMFPRKFVCESDHCVKMQEELE